MTIRVVTKNLTEAEQFISRQVPTELQEALRFALGLANVTIATDESAYVIDNDIEFDALLYVKLILPLLQRNQRVAAIIEGKDEEEW